MNVKRNIRIDFNATPGIFRYRVLTPDYHIKTHKELLLAWILRGWGSIQEWGSNRANTVYEKLFIKFWYFCQSYKKQWLRYWKSCFFRPAFHRVQMNADLWDLYLDKVWNLNFEVISVKGGGKWRFLKGAIPKF